MRVLLCLRRGVRSLMIYRGSGVFSATKRECRENVLERECSFGSV